MKTRTNQTARIVARRGRFTLHPLSFAICLGLSGAALALPQGGKIVAGEATITKPGVSTEVIRQTTDKAIIDWRSFSIAAGERVSFYLPSSSAVTLNRVTGYDPSSILGQMSSNGRIFLLNPYGVVFGAGARVDVGGLVVSTLSMADNDFLASRYSLTSADAAAPARRGAVVNEGILSAPGGSIVLAGPNVNNTGTIVADRGRVGLVAANAVSVDVEGDGLLFFQASATEAANRLAQLGRIQADGGTVEMRAAARGAFADTVLNMAGVVQARTLGSRGGRVVIDGGGDGITAVGGRIDATGLAAGERGGAIAIQGQRVLLDNGSVVDASGSAGGGAIRVGGDFHGANADLRNAEVTGVASGAVLRADAVAAGDGGTVAIWSDGTTRFHGNVSAQGGAGAGNGGFVEVSGKQNLVFTGDVSTKAAQGRNGTLLLDPTDIVIAAAPASANDNQLNANVPAPGDLAGVILAGDAPAGTATISTAKLEAIGVANSINLNATNSITVNALTSDVATANTLTLNTAGGSAQFHSGAGGFSMQPGDTIKVTNGSLLIDSGAGAVNAGALQASGGVTVIGGAVTLNAPISVTAAGAGVTITGATTLAGTGGTIALTGSNAANDVTLGAVNGAGRALAITAGGGDIALGAIGGSAPLATVTLSGNTASLGAVTTTLGQTYSGVGTTTLGGTLTVNTAGAGVVAGPTVLAAGGGPIVLTGSNAANDVTLGTVNGLQTLDITAAGGDVTLGVVGAGATLAGVSITAATAALQNVKTSGDQTYSAAVSAAGITLDAGAGAITASDGGNNFTGTVTLKAGGAGATIRDQNDLVLAAPTLAANAGLTAISGGVLTIPGNLSTGAGSIDLQSAGALTTAGTLSTTSGSISLAGSTLTVNHDLTTSGPSSGAIALTGGAGGVIVAANKTVDAGNGTILVNAGGAAVDLNTSTLVTTNTGPAAITVRNASTVKLGDVTATGGSVVIGVARDVTGAVTQNGATTVSADTLSVSVGAASAVTLDNNNAIARLGSVDRGGNFTLKDVGGGLILTGSVGDGAANSDVDISTTVGALALGAQGITTNGATGNVTLKGVGVTQTAGGSLTVGGVADITGGAGAIDLASASNDFKGNVDLSTSNTAAVRDANALNLTSFSGSGITAIAGTTLSVPGGAITSGGGPIDLEALGGTLATTGNLSSGGGSIALTGAQGLTVAHDLASGNGAITLTGGPAGGLSVTSGKTVDAGSGTITVDGGTSTINLGAGILTTTNNTGAAVTIRNASSVVLGDVTTGATGTTTLGVASDISSAITQAVGTRVSTGTLAASTLNAITLDKANLITNLGPVSRGGGFTLNDAGGLTLSGSIDGPSTANAVAITTSGPLVLGSNSITATTAAGDVTLTAVGVSQSGGSAITAGGTATINAGNGVIDLQSSGNNFASSVGSVVLNTTGALAAIRDVDDLGLAIPSLGANTSLTAIAGGTLALPGGAINVGSGNLDLRSLGGPLSTPGDLTGVGIVLTGAAGLTLANNLTATTVSLNTSNAAITQSAGKIITATGATSFATGSGPVSLGQANVLNSIGGTGGAVSITEASAGGVALDATNVASLSVTTTAAGAPISQNAAVTVSGNTTLSAGTGTGAVTLGNAGNDFNGFAATAGAVSVADSNAIVLNAITAPSLTVDTSTGNGAVTQTVPLNISGLATINAGSGSISLGAANALGSFGATGGSVSLSEGSGAIALGNVVATGLTVDTSAVNGVVTQVPGTTLSVNGATAINAGSGAITLGNAGNTMQSVGAIGGTVLLRDSNALALDAITAASLTVDTSAGNGALTQNAAANVTGSTVVTTGSGAIALTDPGNDFSNLPGNSFSGGAVSVRDSNDLRVTTLVSGANQAVSVVAGLGLTLPAVGIDTGAGDLTLSSGAILSTPGALAGNNITLAGTAGVSIGANIAALGNLNLGASNANVTQGGGSIATGGITTVSAGTGAVSLAQPGNDFNSVNVVSAGSVAINDSTGLTIAVNATGNVSVASTGPLATGGSTVGANIALTGNAGITLGHAVSTPGTLQLTTSNAAITQTNGAIVVGNLTTVAAGSGDITLNQAGNDFSDGFGIAATGGAVRLRDANDLNIVSLANGANKDLSLIAGNAIFGISGNIDTGSADLTIATLNGFTTFGSLRGTNVAVGGGVGGITIGNSITALGNLTLDATNAPITQIGGTISAAGIATAHAGTGNVSLTLPGNNFATFGATGTVVSVRDDNGLTLGGVNAGTLVVNTSAGNGAVLQSGPAVVGGTTSIAAGSGAVTLGNAGNDFGVIGVTGGAVSITDGNALVLNTVNATSLSVVTSAGNGAVSQSGAATITGATTVDAGVGTVALTNLGNNFGSVGATGSVVSITDINALALGAVNAGALTVSAGGAVTQNAAAIVSGATLVNAGASAITLTQAGNDFGSVGATGGAVSITDSNALALDALGATSLTLGTAAGNGAITQNAAAIVGGATVVNAGSGSVTLANAGNNFASVAATGGAVSIADANAVVLGTINATSLSVITAAGNGAVTQSGPAIVSGAGTVNAGSGLVNLGQAGNDFSSLAVSGGAVTVVDATALTLPSLSSGTNQAVSVTAGGALVLPGTSIDTGLASLTLASGGTLTTAGTLRGTNVALSSGAAMALQSDVTALGSLSLTASNAAILQSGGKITAGGSTTVNAGSGDITLAQLANDFQGNVLLTGGAIDVHDANNLTVSTLVSGANKPVELVAGGTLVLPATPIDTGSADLTLQALGGSLVINGTLNGNNLVLTGTTGLTLGANITSSGDQVYTSQVKLGGNVTLNSGSSKIDLQGGVDGVGNSLALVSANAAADAIHTGAPVVNTAQLTVTGNATLGGNVTTTGTQLFSAPVVLGTDVALNAGAARIDLGSTVDAGGHDLSLTSSNAAADAIRARAAISNAAQFTVSGKSTLAAGITTSGTQAYSDTVTLSSHSDFTGSALNFGNGIAAGGFDLGLRADALTLTGAIGGTGRATLSSATAGSSVGVAGGAGTLQFSQTTLDRFAGFSTLTIGRNDGTGNLSFGNLVLPTNMAVVSGSGNADFSGTVASASGQARSLTVDTGGTTTFAAAVGGPIGGTAGLGNLSVTGSTVLGASVTSNGSESFGGPVSLSGNVTLSANAISFGSSLAVGTQALTLFTDSLAMAGAATGTGAGSVRIAPRTAAGTLGVAGGAGTLQVSQGLVNAFTGVPTVSLGRSDSTGTVTVGSIVLPADLSISNGSGNVTFTGSVDSGGGSARDLSVATTGTTAFTGVVGGAAALDVLTVSGPSQLGAAITTSGAQTYSGAATLTADSTLNAPTVSFRSSVDGGRSLTVNAAATNFAGPVGATAALSSLTTDQAGTTQLAGNVITSGAQTYNDALQLNGNAVLSGSTLTLAGTVDGARALTANGSTRVTLGGAIGGATPLASLNVGGPLQLDAGAVTTSGAQDYAGATTLGAGTSLAASSIVFGNTLDGGFGLSVSSAGTTSFAGAVGATSPLASLATGGGGAVTLSGPSVRTTGAQTYSGALQLAGSGRLTGSSLTLAGPVSGATDLTLETNALNGASSLGGTGMLTIAPVDPALAIGVAGGSGALQVSQAVLNGASGFSGHVIGRADGTGPLSTGALVLRSDTTLQTGSGDLTVGASVDGAFALTLNSGGTTRIAGPIGAAAALKSLSTDNNATAADWDGTTGERTSFDTTGPTGSARVITTGAQTYNDPVTATVPIVLTGGAIAATQTANRFDGAVSVSADTLNLRNSTDLQLGAVTLLNGGAIEADGVVHLTGALRLDGGTLVLSSNAIPTPIDLSDPEFAGKALSFGFVPVKEASATIVQDPGGSVASSAGSLLVLRSPGGGSVLLEQPGNALLGQLSAVTGALGDNDAARFNAAATITLGFIRIDSREIHVAGRPPADGNQALQAAGLEADAIKLTADVVTTGPDGLIRARLPFNNIQGAQTSLPGLTLSMSPEALLTGNGFGSPSAGSFIQVQIGATEGGFITARPNGASGNTAVIFLGGNAAVRPFYDGNGKITEIRIFYNGDAPRTPQEAGALAAVIALIEEARHARFEEAVRTENVSSRLRSGVIAEVGAGRPATVGRESIRLPDTCEIKPKALQCQ